MSRRLRTRRRRFDDRAAYKRDFLTIIKADAPDDQWDKYAYVEEGSPSPSRRPVSQATTAT